MNRPKTNIDFGYLPGLRESRPRLTAERLVILACAALLSFCGPSAALAEPYFQQQPLFVAGDGTNYTGYRVPALVVANSGDLLAFAEGRIDNINDNDTIDIVLRRSSDGGQTWLPMQTVIQSPGGGVSYQNPTPVVDATTGTIYLNFIIDATHSGVTKSTDNGATWSPMVDTSSQIQDPTWKFYATGPGHGIQLIHQNDPSLNGRLVQPAYHRVDGTGYPTPSFANSFYSDDHGASFNAGGTVATPNTNESQIVETVNGDLLMTMRDRNAEPNSGYRWYSWSHDGGETWTPAKLDFGVVDSNTQGSIVRFSDATNDGDDRNRILLANASATKRRNMTVRVAYDEVAAAATEGAPTWDVSRTVYFGNSAYSDLAVTGGPSVDSRTVNLVYERGRANGSILPNGNYVGIFQTITFAQFNRSWLEDGTSPYNVYLKFNEQASGTAPSNDGFIHDSGGWDMHAQALDGPTYSQDLSHPDNSALRFTEGNDMVILLKEDAPTFWNFGPTDSFTLETAIQTTSHASGGFDQAGVLVSNGINTSGSHWWLQIEDGYVNFTVKDNANHMLQLTSTVTVTDGLWHQIAAVRNAESGLLELFIDSKKDGEISGILGDLTNSFNTQIGQFGDYQRQFDGLMDYFRATKSALLPDQFVQMPSIFTPDVNGDDIVNQLDLNLVFSNWLATGASRSQGDTNGDGVVNQLDVNVITGNWLADMSNSQVVPEPASLSLLLVGLLGLLRRRASNHLRYGM